MTHFWDRGREEYLRALEDKYLKKIDALEKQLERSHDEKQRAAIERDIRELKQHLDDEFDRSDGFLF